MNDEEPHQLDGITISADPFNDKGSNGDGGEDGDGRTSDDYSYPTTQEIAAARQAVEAALAAFEYSATEADLRDLVAMLPHYYIGIAIVLGIDKLAPPNFVTPAERAIAMETLKQLDAILDTENLTRSQVEEIWEQIDRLKDIDFFGSGFTGGSRLRGGPKDFDGLLGLASPIIFDLDGDGAELNIQGTPFDVDSDGFLEMTDWAAPDDGFLVIDLDTNGSLGQGGDGTVTNAKEIILTRILGRTDITDLQALALMERQAVYGGNNDSRLNSADALWKNLKIWQDKDQNGVVDQGEMKTLAEAGITEIKLSYDDGTNFADRSNDIEVFGSIQRGSASYVRTNGSVVKGGIVDMSLAYNTSGFRKVETAYGYDIQFESGAKLSIADLEGKASANLNLDLEAVDGAVGDARANVVSAQGHSRSVQIVGGGGDDVLTGGENDDILSGDAGADQMRGMSGNDLIFFDAADLTAGKLIEGNGGIDTAYAVGSGSVSFKLIDHSFEAAYGGLGSDRLDGSGLSDDVPMFGGNGNDTLVGGEGDDNLSGDSGSDLVSAGNGDDRLSGGDGNDTLNGNAGSDVLTGGNHDDLLAGGTGDDLLFGGSGADSLAGNGDDDRVDGGTGDDTLDGQEGDDVLSGGAGNDRLIFWRGDDTLSGESGNDTFLLEKGISTHGFWGWAVLQGGTGDDILHLPLASGDWFWTRLHPDRNQWKFYRHQADGGEVIVMDVQDIEKVRFADGVVKQLSTNTGIDTSDSYIRKDFDVFTGDTDTDQGSSFRSSDGALNGYMGNDFLDTERLKLINGGSSGPDYEVGVYHDFVRGMTGQDTILASLGNDRVHGESGSDALYGEGGLDQLYGSSGSDQIWGGDGNDTIQGNAGSDILSGDAGDDSIDGDDGGDFINGGRGNDTLVGGMGSDVLNGGLDNDLLQGGVGADRLNGEDGHDRLEGGAGTDSLFGGNGNDTLLGEDGFNLLSGDAGNDVLVGGSDDDLLSGGEGIDKLAGGSGRDTLVGGAGADTLDGGSGILDLVSYEGSSSRVVVDLEVISGADTLQTANGGDATNDILTGFEQVWGSDHNDAIGGSSADNVLAGGKGNDALSGGDGHDDLIGGEGDDTLSHGNGDDRIWGDAGNDVIKGAAGQDTIYGGAGWDTFDFSTSAASVSIDFTTQVHSGFAAGNLIYQVEHIAAGSGNDTLRGGGGANRIDGGAGNDLLIATLGSDTLIGGTGVDRVSYEKFTSGIVADLVNEAANTGGSAGDIYEAVENLTGTVHDDTLRGGATGNNLQGGAGDDRLEGREGNDALGGADGNDSLDGGSGADTMVGGAGNDVYWVNDTEDVIGEAVSGGTDRILTSISIDLVANDGAYTNVEHIQLQGSANLIGAGSAANNSIIGNSGVNLLSGREGADALTGGAGADTFRFRKNFDHDTILDFQDNVDTIEVLDFGVTSFTQLRTYATQSGSDVIFDFGNGDGLTIRNITISALADDIVYV